MDQSQPLSATEVCEHFREYTYIIAYRLANDHFAAEDIAQEALIRIFRNYQRFQPGNLKAWIRRIVYNLFYTYATQTRKRQKYCQTCCLDHQTDDRLNEIPDPWTLSPEDIVIEYELHDALNSLPADWQSIVQLELDGYSYTEIAHTLQIPTGTVRSRLHRARHRLIKYYPELTGLLKPPAA